jgi:hypothetical protein
MKVTPRSRRRIQTQNFLFTLLFVAAMGLLAWVSTQYDFKADWTYGHRNSLSPASVKLLGTAETLLRQLPGGEAGHPPGVRGSGPGPAARPQ